MFLWYAWPHVIGALFQVVIDCSNLLMPSSYIRWSIPSNSGENSIRFDSRWWIDFSILFDSIRQFFLYNLRLFFDSINNFFCVWCFNSLLTSFHLRFTITAFKLLCPRQGALTLSDDAAWRLSDVWRLSVCLTSVAYIGNNSRTERHRKIKIIGTQVTHVTRD